MRIKRSRLFSILALALVSLLVMAVLLPVLSFFLLPLLLLMIPVVVVLVPLAAVAGLSYLLTPRSDSTEVAGVSNVTELAATAIVAAHDPLASASL